MVPMTSLKGPAGKSRIRFATTNSLKFSEAEALRAELLQLDIELPEIQAIDVSEVVLDKMDSVARMRFEFPVVVEDTGLEISSLSGLPGAFVKWFIKSLGSEGLSGIALKDGHDKVPATAVSAVGAVWGSDRKICIGRTEGFIVSPRGEDFGWNSVFLCAGSDLTFGELSAFDRLAVSMRRKPLQDAFAWLDDR